MNLWKVNPEDGPGESMLEEGIWKRKAMLSLSISSLPKDPCCKLNIFQFFQHLATASFKSKCPDGPLHKKEAEATAEKTDSGPCTKKTNRGGKCRKNWPGLMSIKLAGANVEKTS